MLLQKTGPKDQIESKALRLPLWSRAAETARGVPRGSAHWRGRGATPRKPEDFALQKTKSRTKNRAKPGQLQKSVRADPTIRLSGWSSGRKSFLADGNSSERIY